MGDYVPSGEEEAATDRSNKAFIETSLLRRRSVRLDAAESSSECPDSSSNTKRSRNGSNVGSQHSVGGTELAHTSRQSTQHATTPGRTPGRTPKRTPKSPRKLFTDAETVVLHQVKKSEEAAFFDATLAGQHRSGGGVGGKCSGCVCVGGSSGNGAWTFEPPPTVSVCLWVVGG